MGVVIKDKMGRSTCFALRIDTGAWDVIGVVVCISCSTPHRLISDTPYERSIFLLLNCIKHVNINEDLRGPVWAVGYLHR